MFFSASVFWVLLTVCHMASGNVNTRYFPKSGWYVQLFYMNKEKY